MRGEERRGEDWEGNNKIFISLWWPQSGLAWLGRTGSPRDTQSNKSIIYLAQRCPHSKHSHLTSYNYVAPEQVKISFYITESPDDANSSEMRGILIIHHSSVTPY